MRPPARSCVLLRAVRTRGTGQLAPAPHARYAHQPRAYRAYRDTPAFGARSLRMCQHYRRANPPNSRHAPRSWRSMAAHRCCARSAPPTQQPLSSICTRCLLLPACALLEARERLQPHASCLQALHQPVTVRNPVQPALLEAWERLDDGRYAGSADGRPVWLTVSLEGRLPSDPREAPGYIEALGGRIYELGAPGAAGQRGAGLAPPPPSPPPATVDALGGAGTPVPLAAAAAAVLVAGGLGFGVAGTFSVPPPPPPPPPTQKVVFLAPPRQGQAIPRTSMEGDGSSRGAAWSTRAGLAAALAATRRSRGPPARSGLPSSQGGALAARLPEEKQRWRVCWCLLKVADPTPPRLILQARWHRRRSRWASSASGRRTACAATRPSSRCSRVACRRHSKQGHSKRSHSIASESRLQARRGRGLEPQVLRVRRRRDPPTPTPIPTPRPRS